MAHPPVIAEFARRGHRRRLRRKILSWRAGGGHRPNIVLALHAVMNRQAGYARGGGAADWSWLISLQDVSCILQNGRRTNNDEARRTYKRATLGHPRRGFAVAEPLDGDTPELGAVPAAHDPRPRHHRRGFLARAGNPEH